VQHQGVVGGGWRFGSCEGLGFVLDLSGLNVSTNWACLYQIWLAPHTGKLDSTLPRSSLPCCVNTHQISCLFFRNVCVPENGEESSMCTCTIYPDYFVSGLTYILALQFNGTSMWNSSVTPAQVGKKLFILSPGCLVSGFAVLATLH